MFLTNINFLNMSKYLFSLLIFSFYTLANSQITTELISDKKDDILLKSNESISFFINHVHPVDTTSLTYINNIILLESKKYLKELGSDEYITITWMTDNFYYSSVLETAVILNQLILKIKLIEKESLALLLSKTPSGY